MVLVAVAEHQRVDGSDAIDIRKQPRRWTLAEVQHHALASGFEQETSRAFGADAGDKPQRSRSSAHGLFEHIWQARAALPTLTITAPILINRAARNKAMKVRNSL